MTLLVTAVTLGLVAFFVHFAVNNAPFLTPITTRLPAPLQHLARCPFCIGPYVALPFAVILHTPTGSVLLDVASVLVVTLAAAAVSGIIGSLIPDDGSPT